MAKVKYNVKGVERGGGNYTQPQPGLYTMQIHEANLRQENGKNDIELILEVVDEGEFKGSRVWTYVGLGESSQWKLAELVDALGLPENGEIDTKKLVGKQMKVKINADSWNDEYRARAGRFAPMGDEDPEADPSDPDDPDAGDGDPDAEPEHVTIELNDVELSSDPSYYDDWTDDDVKEEVENQSLEITGRYSRKKVIEALCALGVEVVKAWRSVYFSSLADIVASLAKAERDGTLRERIRYYCRFALLMSMKPATSLSLLVAATCSSSSSTPDMKKAL